MHRYAKMFVQSRSRDVLWSGNTGTDQLLNNQQTRGRLAVVPLFQLSEDFSATTRRVPCTRRLAPSSSGRYGYHLGRDSLEYIEFSKKHENVLIV